MSTEIKIDLQALFTAIINQAEQGDQVQEVLSVMANTLQRELANRPKTVRHSGPLEKIMRAVGAVLQGEGDVVVSYVKNKIDLGRKELLYELEHPQSKT